MNNETPHREQLEDWRKSIDNLDSALIAILAERFRLTEKIGRTKAAVGVEPTDSKREERQREQFCKWASSHHLKVEVALDIMAVIIQSVKDRHEQLQRDGGHSPSL